MANSILKAVKALCIACSLIYTGCMSFRHNFGPADTQATNDNLSTFSYNSDRMDAGNLYTYTAGNSDGSRSMQVYVYAHTPTQIFTYKDYPAPGGNEAYSYTAALSPDYFMYSLSTGKNLLSDSYRTPGLLGPQRAWA